jgi:hypothetical protein
MGAEVEREVVEGLASQTERQPVTSETSKS